MEPLMTLSSLYYTCTICRNAIINKIIYHVYETSALKAQRNVLMLLKYFAREIKLRQIASLKKKIQFLGNIGYERVLGFKKI